MTTADLLLTSKIVEPQSPHHDEPPYQRLVIQHTSRVSGSEYGHSTTESEAYLQTNIVNYQSLLIRLHKHKVKPCLNVTLIFKV